ncbi:hypothetical protein COT52_01585 [candidate division WWE3 bacterium CG08_land_8_20_14_0_20_43_13]|uniref:Uncharacterized protein n=1 Tax=candidate division WWE3 bacterium CG08_land_8_20_14_0_20_43_13 TaxID=1975087 RepID=A0A2H0X7N8_UNCKA|nr:MAG: hypothetical protein COT52_01585 [candidate division WWE3 bacterium CG08_land_8_20_14_0_20_43_13]
MQITNYKFQINSNIKILNTKHLSADRQEFKCSKFKYQNIIIFLVLNLEKFESAPSLPAEEEGS